MYIFVSIDNFKKFIKKNKPVVFTKETVDPFACGHQAFQCQNRVSDAYAGAGVTQGLSLNGQPCDNFAECNDRTFGPLSNNWRIKYLSSKFLLCSYFFQHFNL